MIRRIPHATLAVAALSAILVGMTPAPPVLVQEPVEVKHRYDTRAMDRLVARIVRQR